MTKFVAVVHDGIEGTAMVPEVALEHYAKAGWKPANQKKAASATTPPPELAGDAAAEKKES